MTPEELAGATIEELKGYIERLMVRKQDNADMLVFMEGPFGRRWAESKRAQLAAVRDEYAKIDVNGAAEVCVRQLMANITREKFLQAEVKAIDGAEKSQKIVDAELQQCNNALRVKEAAARQGR